MRRLVLLVSFLAACATPVGVRNTEVPRDAAPQCASICQTMGLPLDSVVVMADNIGCVCRAAAPPPVAAPPGGAPGDSSGQPSAAVAPASSSAGGMAAVLMARAAQQRQQQQAASSRRR